MEHLLGEISAGKTLIPGDISKRLLNSIMQDKYDHNLLSEYKISAQEIQQLSKLYHTEKEITPTREGLPRYFAFYTLLEKKMPQIKWVLKKNKDNKNKVNFYFPLINNLQPSIMSLLLDRVKIIGLSLYTKYSLGNQFPAEKRDCLYQFLVRSEAIYPNKASTQGILHWINKAFIDESSTLFIHTCPDYAVEPTHDPQRPYKHTFNGLGSGIGQIARRILDILPHLKVFLTTLKLSPRIIVTIADYEAFSEENLNRMNLSKQQFLERVNSSRMLFELEAQKVLPLSTFMCSDFCGSEQIWKKNASSILQAFQQGAWVDKKINRAVFTNIAKRRKALYSRWYNQKLGLEYYIQVAMSQAAEYAVIGHSLSKKTENCLILGADDILFSPFYSISKPIPAIYFKRRYC